MIKKHLYSLHNFKKFVKAIKHNDKKSTKTITNIDKKNILKIC